MEVTTIGLDLAKNIFQVHGITENEEVAFNRPLRQSRAPSPVLNAHKNKSVSTDCGLVVEGIVRRFRVNRLSGEKP
jgi:hypothetical protein